MKLFKLVIQGQ